MAISAPVPVGGIGASSGSTTSFNVPITTTIPANSRIFVLFSAIPSSGTLALTGGNVVVTDPAGNTYSGFGVQSTSTLPGGVVMTTYTTVSIPSGSNINIALGTGTMNRYVASVYYVTGVTDYEAGATASNTGTTATVTLPAANTQADMLVWAVGFDGRGTGYSGSITTSGYTNLPKVGSSAGSETSGEYRVVPAYKITTAIETSSVSFATTASGAKRILIGSYKGGEYSTPVTANVPAGTEAETEAPVVMRGGGSLIVPAGVESELPGSVLVRAGMSRPVPASAEAELSGTPVMSVVATAAIPFGFEQEAAGTPVISAGTLATVPVNAGVEQEAGYNPNVITVRAPLVGVNAGAESELAGTPIPTGLAVWSAGLAAAEAEYPLTPSITFERSPLVYVPAAIEMEATFPAFIVVPPPPVAVGSARRTVVPAPLARRAVMPGPSARRVRTSTYQAEDR